jgi:hypothetical protein
MKFEHVMPFGILNVTLGEENIVFTLVIDGNSYNTISPLPRIDEFSFADTLKFYSQKPEIEDCYETKKMRVFSLGFSLGNGGYGGECEVVKIVEFQIPLCPEENGELNKSETSADDPLNKPSILDKAPLKNPAIEESSEKKSSYSYARRTLLTWFARNRNKLNIAHAQFLIDNDRSFGRKCDNLAAIKRSIKALNVTISTATEVRDRLEEVLAQNKSD